MATHRDLTRVSVTGIWLAIALGSLVRGSGLAAAFAAGRWKRSRA